MMGSVFLDCILFHHFINGLCFQDSLKKKKKERVLYLVISDPKLLI